MKPKYWIPPLIILIALFVVIFKVKAMLSCAPELPDIGIVVDNWTDTLTVSGYQPAEIVDEPEMIDELPESVGAVVYAEGSAGDVEVQISVVETPDDTLWIKAVIDGVEVKFRKIHYSPMVKPVHSSDWSLLMGAEWVDGLDIGLGIAYEPLEFHGVYGGLQGMIDLNADLADSPDWGSLGLRLSTRWKAFSIGGYGGWRFGEDAGFSCGVDWGVVLDI